MEKHGSDRGAEVAGARLPELAPTQAPTPGTFLKVDRMRVGERVNPFGRL